MIPVSHPFRPGTFSLAVYPHDGSPHDMLASVFAQAKAAEEAGFEGVTVSEHHGGFASYLPNPLQVAGWILDRTNRMWSGPCPLLLPLRPAAVTAEEIAWLAALHPGRVGVGLAPGYAVTDFDLVGTPFDERASEFTERLRVVAAATRGRGEAPLGRDPAIAATRQAPVPMVAAAGSVTAARRAARAGVGLMTDSMAGPDRVRAALEAYAEEGGNGPRVLNRRVWIGDPPAELVEAQAKAYREAGGSASWVSDDPMRIAAGTVDEVADVLIATTELTGPVHLGLKVHVAGIEHGAIIEQVTALGEALDCVRSPRAGRTRAEPSAQARRRPTER